MGLPSLIDKLNTLISSLSLPYSEHLGPTYRAYALSGWLAILHGNGLDLPPKGIPLVKLELPEF